MTSTKRKSKGSSDKSSSEPRDWRKPLVAPETLATPEKIVAAEVEPSLPPPVDPPAPPPPEKAPRRPASGEVPLRVFLVLSGKKQDQLAGFSRWATSQKLKPRSVRAWREEITRYNNTPVR